MAWVIPDRCRDPECDAPLAAQHPGMSAADLPAGHRFHYSRGLCQVSYTRAMRRRLLHLYPRSSRTRDEVLDTWQRLRRPPFDYSAAQIAQALGMAPSAMSNTLADARREGDPRAVPGRNTRFQSRRSFREGGARGWARWDLFDTDTRDYYKLEELWADAKKIDWERED